MTLHVLPGGGGGARGKEACTTWVLDAVLGLVACVVRCVVMCGVLCVVAASCQSDVRNATAAIAVSLYG